MNTLIDRNELIAHVEKDRSPLAIMAAQFIRAMPAESLNEAITLAVRALELARQGDTAGVDALLDTSLLASNPLMKMAAKALLYDATNH